MISGFRWGVAKICAFLGNYAANSGTKVRKNPEERSPQRLNIFSPLRARTLQVAHSGTVGCYGHLAVSQPLTVEVAHSGTVGFYRHLTVSQPLTLEVAHSGTVGCYGHLVVSQLLTFSEFIVLRVVKIFTYKSHSHWGCGGIAPFILKLATVLWLTGQPHAVLCFGKEPPSVIWIGVWVGGSPGLSVCENRNGSCTCLKSSGEWSVL